MIPRLCRLTSFAVAAFAAFVVAPFVIAHPAHAQTFTESVIYSFCSQGGSECSDGGGPSAALLQGPGAGTFYGTASAGGSTTGPATGAGTVFSITPSGTLSTLYRFCTLSACADGELPYAALIAGANGSFYGTTNGGDQSSNYGTIFSISAAGKLTTLYSFCSQANCADGEGPSGLVLGTDGNYYGTTFMGGANGAGTVFSLTPANKLTTLYSFCSKGGTACTDGSEPHNGNLVEGTDKNFYGTTESGGPSNYGTIFSITPLGQLTTVYDFCSQSGCTDGATPLGNLIQAIDHKFYGITANGGTNGVGAVFSITLTGTYTTLYSFCTLANCSDGASPEAGLLQGSDGNFYGTTNDEEVTNGGGSVFMMTPTGKLTTLHSFCDQDASGCVDGQFPAAPLIEGTDGTLYGTTTNGGTEQRGTVFRITGLTASKSTSSTTLTATPDTVSPGQTATFQATVSGASGTPAGTVSFSADGYAIGACTLTSGSCSYTASASGVPPGTYPVVASFSGSSTYDSSMSAAVNVAVTKAATSTALAVSPNPVTPPADGTLTATVKRSPAGSGTPTGTVTFYYQTLVIGTATLNSSGVASLSVSTNGVPAASYSLTAKYNGDNGDASSASPAVNATVK